MHGRGHKCEALIVAEATRHRARVDVAELNRVTTALTFEVTVREDQEQRWGRGRRQGHCR
jgi:hypothetical protein